MLAELVEAHCAVTDDAQAWSGGVNNGGRYCCLTFERPEATLQVDLHGVRQLLAGGGCCLSRSMARAVGG
jgi:hypothetical protein